MHIAFLNPQGNFDPADSYWTEHPDFGGQLVYVKEAALAMARLGHRVDILTRRIIDSNWPEFSAHFEGYPGSNVRILRLPCGPGGFLPKEALWPFLGTEWVQNILGFYDAEGGRPDCFTAHYGDGGLAAALIARQAGIPFTFTAHSLGAQKMDKLGASPDNLAQLDEQYNFRYRIFAERAAMAYAGRTITSTNQERMEQYGHPAYQGVVDLHNNNRFAVVPPGVNLEVFSFEPASIDAQIETRIAAALRRDLAPGRQELPLVLLSSRLDPKKNHLGVVEAFARSPELQEKANLAVVVRGLDDPIRSYGRLNAGESTVFGQIVDRMHSAGLSGKLTAFPLNSQAELASAYRVLAGRRSVFCLTALYEPFGLAPLEAMSCGLPVVVTRNGGPSESLFENGVEYGILVNPVEPLDIACGLLRLVSNPGTWQTFQDAGFDRVQSKYTWDRTAEGYLVQIRALLTEPSSMERATPIPGYFSDPAQPLHLSELSRVYFSNK